MPVRAFFDGGKVCVEGDMTANLAKKMQALTPSTTGRNFNVARRRWEFSPEAYPVVAKVLGIDLSGDFASWRETVKGSYNVRLAVGASVVRISAIGDFNLPVADVRKLCSYRVPGYAHTEAYKSGKWDGYTSLFDSTANEFPAGLLQRVIAALYAKGISAELAYNTVPPVQEFPDWKIPFALRDYQISAGQKAINAPFGKGIIQIATGGGKTNAICYTIAQLGVKTLYLVHTRDLLYQAKRDVARAIPAAAPIGQIGDGVFDVSRPVTVATLQTLARHLPQFRGKAWVDDLDDFDEEDREVIKIDREADTDVRQDSLKSFIESVQLTVQDECHHAPSEMAYNILQNIHSYYKIGLSASPWRDDGLDLKLEASLGQRVESISATTLINKGYLVTPVIRFVRVPAATYPRGSQFATVYKQYVVDNAVRNKIVAAIAKQEAQSGRQALVLVKQVRHGNVLMPLMPPKTVFLHGDLPAGDRAIHLQAFRNKEFPVMVATTLADEGLDIPSLDTVVLAGGGKSTTRVLQRIGRATRLHDDCPSCESSDTRLLNRRDCSCNQCGHTWKYAGKFEANIYDFIDNATCGTKRWLYDHSLRRKETMESERGFVIKQVAVEFR